MDKKFYSNNLPIGENIKEIFMIDKAINYSEDNNGKSVKFILSDMNGKCDCYIKTELLKFELHEYVGKMAVISGFCSIQHSRPIIKATEVEIQEGTVAREVIAALTADESISNGQIIYDTVTSIKNENYKLLCTKLITRNVMTKLVDVPYALKGAGTYAGAPLCIAANMINMAKSMVEVYNAGTPMLYSGADKIDLDLVLTAILLHVSAKHVEYTTYPFKAADCVRLEGPFVVLWQNITAMAITNKINLNSSDMKYLCSVLQDLYKTETAPSLKEGILVSSIRDMYMKLQHYDKEFLDSVDSGKLERGDFSYSTDLKLYLHIKEQKGEEGEKSDK